MRYLVLCYASSCNCNQVKMQNGMKSHAFLLSSPSLWGRSWWEHESGSNVVSILTRSSQASPSPTLHSVQFSTYPRSSTASTTDSCCDINVVLLMARSSIISGYWLMVFLSATLHKASACLPVMCQIHKGIFDDGQARGG